MEKNDFIGFLQRSSPEEVLEFIKSKGKRKKVCPIIQYPEDYDISELLKEVSNWRTM